MNYNHRGYRYVCLRCVALLIALIMVTVQFSSGTEVLSEMTSVVSAAEAVSVNNETQLMNVTTRNIEVPVVSANHSQNSQKPANSIPPKIVYLTFDDGPSKVTDDVLDILDTAGVKATFFVIGENAERYPEKIRKLVDSGHSLGNHTYNHEYNELYTSFNGFWSQIKRTEEIIRQITDVRPALIRAPGGTYGHFDKTYFNLLEQGGYRVTDWNVDSGDSKRRDVKSSEIVANVIKGKQPNPSVVLMHDGAGHVQTAKALPEIIKYYKDLGYEFRTLTEEVTPVHFSIHVSDKWKGRKAPSADWVRSHIAPNVGLFHKGLPLRLEAGNVQTELKTGEYRLVDHRYVVPLRTTMERLGGSVKWNEKQEIATLSWGKYELTVDARNGVMHVVSPDSAHATYQIEVEIINDSIWIPLRSLLESVGHPIKSITMNENELQIKAL